MIRDHLARVPETRLALIAGTRKLYFGELSQVQRDSAWACFDDQVVALCLGDLAAALRAISALDGRASALFLASPTFPPVWLARLASFATARVLLTDQPAKFSGLGGRPPVVVIGPELAPTRDSMYKPDTAGQAAVRATRWLLSTSGTTDVPKLVSHPLRSLTRTTKFDTVRGAEVRWGLLYDYTRFAGLQVVLQALLSGSTLIAPSLESPLSAQVAYLAEYGCTHLSATPTLWRKLLMTPGTNRLPLRQITLGGEIVDQPILNALAREFPQAKLRHIFASTEAGVGFSVADGKEGFPASFIDKPPAGIALKVVYNRLFVRNEHVTPNYLGDETRFCDAEGFVDTGDEVVQQGDRYLFLGRANGTINVGGNKVHPEAVERVLMAHPEVAFAKVGAKRNPITGALVTADVVPTEPTVDAGELRDRLFSYCRMHLDRHAVPALLQIVPELHLNVAGKITRGIPNRGASTR